MNKFFLIIAVLLQSIAMGQEMSPNSPAVTKFIYLNVPGHSGRSEGERQFEKELFESFKPDDMPILCDYVRKNYKTNLSGTIIVFGKLIARFDESGEKFNRDECVDLIIEILDYHSHDHGTFSQYLRGASRVLDSRLLSYVNSQEASKSEYCKSMVKTMNERWHERKNFINMPANTQNDDASANQDTSSTTSNTLKQKSPSKSPLFIGGLVLLTLLTSLYVLNKWR